MLSNLRTSVLILITTLPATAQVASGGLPEGLVRPFATPAPFLAVPAPDVARYLADDEARNNRPLRYGALLALDVTLADGEWTRLPDQSRVWRLRIAAPGARSLSIEFSQFDLPPGARLYVWDEAVETVLGAYTAANRHEDGGFVFEPFPGDELTLELFVPAGARDPVIAARELVWDYRGVLAMLSGTAGGTGGGQQMSCLIDVNCPEGANWSNQKRATLQTASEGFLCSGALLNNTGGNGLGYVLTANHCMQSSNTIFVFLNQLPGCSTGTAPTNLTVSGCTVIAGDSTVDNRLLRIGPAIPAAFDPYYAGWTRSNQNATFAFTMGHPGGGPKKIAIDGNGTSVASPFWALFWSQGLVQGGSSGGPLFDQNGRVMGPACCVDNFVCGTQNVYFGQFYQFWNVPAVAAALDPLGLNPTTLDGLDPFQTPPPLPVCFGDGSGTTCPCGNTSPVGSQVGCLNSLGVGGWLFATGSASVTSDTLALHGAQMPNAAALYFQGTSLVNGGAGAVFGDGLRCAGGAVVRFGTKTNVNGVSTYPQAGDLAIHVAGADVAGNLRVYQCWYRNAAAFCQSATYNLSNGLLTTWTP